MDPVERASLRARRLQRAALASSVEARFQTGPFSLRPAMLQATTGGLRSAIERKVQAFVLPGASPATAEVVCPKLLVEFRADGYWLLNARIEALVQEPTAFVIGFSVNEHRYFGFLLGAVNFQGGPAEVSTPTNAATVSIYGVSRWLSFNFMTACTEGVTFRLRSVGTAESPRFLVQEWMKAFPAPLHRPMSILDDDKSDYVAWGWSPGMGSLLDDAEDDKSGLSFDVALRFD